MNVIVLFLVVCATACAMDASGTAEDDEATAVEGLVQEISCTGNLCNDTRDRLIDTGIRVTGQFTGNGQCYAYKDASFRGASQALQEGWTYTNVGSAFNDQISSFRVAAPNCVIMAWMDINRHGEGIIFPSDTTNVGNDFNDRISSWSCACD